MIKVIVCGALGRMGQEVLRAVCSDPEMEAVGAVDIKASSEYLGLPHNSGEIPLSSDLEKIIAGTKPDVMVDFTIPQAAMPSIRTAAGNRISLVIGTTGFSQQDFDEIERLGSANGIGIVVAANFSLGAVLMMHLAKIASRYFDYAEIIEKHHEKKADAPSGTALATARAMLESRGKDFTMPPLDKETLAGTRGGQMEGISIHSVRLPGYLAHQDIILGAAGQTLKISHDTISREAFMPGVIMAIKHVAKDRGFVHGLDKLLGLQG